MARAKKYNQYVLTDWRPENKKFWQQKGRKIATRNLWVSIFALLLAFAVWQVWSVVVTRLQQAGFPYSYSQLFWLAALPGISGATLRIFYSFMVPVFGGRRWTAWTTWSLLIPAVGIGIAVQNTHTPYWVMALLALFCGFGGGNFSSSMANISFFYPRREKGKANGLNAGLGNLGVSVVQFIVPIVIATSAFGWLGGAPLTVRTASGATAQLWLQNAAFIFVPFIIISALLAQFLMNDIADAKASFSEQAIIFKRRDTWLMCILYMGTFGSFIGYAAAFPLLISTTYPYNTLFGTASTGLVFLGPLISALARSFTGGLSDRLGGGRMTIVAFLLMVIALLVVLICLKATGNPFSFYGFFFAFMVLFFATGLGNASTFQMIPAIISKVVDRAMRRASLEKKRHEADKETAAITGFTAAIAAYFFFFIPTSFAICKAYGYGPEPALWMFLVFYILCLFITWFFYTRKGALLYHEGQNNKRG